MIRNDVLKNNLLKFAYNSQKYNYLNDKDYNEQELFVSKQSLLVVHRTCK